MSDKIVKKVFLFIWWTHSGGRCTSTI